MRARQTRWLVIHDATAGLFSAILKAAGCGICDSREIGLSAAGTIQTRSPPSFAPREDWSLTHVVADGIVGAVACRPQRKVVTA